MRCPKVGTVCPGYREEQDLVFHNQSTASYAKKSRKPKEHRNREAVVNGKYSASSTSTVSPLSDQESRAVYVDCVRPPSLPPRIVADWNTYIVPVVLHYLSSRTDGPRFYGYLDFLPELYRETGDDAGSCLILATNAMAKAYVTNLSVSSVNRNGHVQTYGRALKATNSALGDPLERVKDSTIIAVWLLGVHEVRMTYGCRALSM
ncbi:hypothetical protein LTR47_007593 [Exophiala xenobiotica]|nr:hypothetical protein LTR41_008745 [Exophiala xenobiotica]KAK5223512.1 hypothetical protein LTR72_004898 [Exophiala xenobiotica]KAK5230451.1 hypothetical protein LTR47_007593 [Exophiala xenobiotica]KAK5259850.1 hypothetical protein LTR40_005211 [Exophiala xenobiotica]KAK5286403.1 hypothetical protein LTR14_010071 [Exophiala xenobiotica]